MASFSYRIGRKLIHWSDHALERWWERCEANELLGHRAALTLLQDCLADCQRLSRELPPWSKVTLYHRARAEGFIYIDSRSGFIVNRNANGDYVAVTYIEDDNEDRARTNPRDGRNSTWLGPLDLGRRRRRSDRGIRRTREHRREQGRKVHAALTR